MTQAQEKLLLIAQQIILVMAKASEIAQHVGHAADQKLVDQTDELARQANKLRDMVRDARGLTLGVGGGK